MVANDADVCLLLLHYRPEFMKSGLSELWLKCGVETKVWFVPLHLLITGLDQNICDVLLKAHILTGCDFISKIGTKSTAVKSNSHVYFGENKLLESSFIDAEMYLVKVLQRNSTSTTLMNCNKNSVARKAKPSMTSHLHHNLSKDI